MIPARHSCGHYDLINSAASRLKKVVFVIYNDEEGIFHADQLKHPNMIRYWFMPPFSPKQEVDRVGPNGYPTDAIEMIAAAGGQNRVRDIPWSFYGQMTHSRRIECVNATQELDGGKLLVTEGFTQGAPRAEYYDVLTRSKLVLCPSGPCTPDSFRFAEALEAGSVPIVDDLIQHASYPAGYWSYLFGDSLPFPLIHDWKVLPEVVEKYLDGWQQHSRNCRQWWAEQKDRMVSEMRSDLEQ